MAHLHTQSRAKRCSKAVILSGAILGASVLGGCDSAGEGLFSGAALGAVTGLVIGSMSGDAGEGAAIGAVLGGAGGAIVGDQNKRNRENARYQGHSSHQTYVRIQDRGHRNGHPYCSSHRVYHSCSTHRGHSHEYHYDEWWND